MDADTEAPRTAPAQTLSDRLNLAELIAGLMSDLKLLREGRITVPNARARAELARQALRGVHFVVVAQKYLDNLPPLPAPPAEQG